MAKKEKKVLHPNIINVRVSNGNVEALKGLKAMINESNMTKNEYLETVIIGHIQTGKVLNKVAISV